MTRCLSLRNERGLKLAPRWDCWSLRKIIVGKVEEVFKGVPPLSLVSAWGMGHAVVFFSLSLSASFSLSLCLFDCVCSEGGGGLWVRVRAWIWMWMWMCVWWGHFSVICREQPHQSYTWYTCRHVTFGKFSRIIYHFFPETWESGTTGITLQL